MALQWCDDFKSYGSTPAYMLNGLYASVSGQLVTDPDPTASGNVLLLGNTAFFDNARKVLGTPSATVGMGARVWLGSLPGGSANPCFFRFNDGANVTHVSIAVTSTGVIQAWRGTQTFSTGTLLGSSSAPVLVANAFQHVEAKVLISDTVGTVEVRVNGVTVLNLTNQDTGNSADLTVAQVVLSPSSRGDLATQEIPIYFKDFVVWDSTGTLNNDFFGSVSVSAMAPDGDDTNTWARSSGTVSNTLINESDPVDTSYISDAFPAAAKQVNTLSDLPSNVTAVKALMTLTRAANSDGGTGNIKTGLVSGATSGLGADKALTSAFTYYTDIWETDPNTAAAWTVANANAAKISFTRTA